MLAHTLPPVIQRLRGDLNLILPVHAAICAFSCNRGQNLNRPIYPGQKAYDSILVVVGGAQIADVGRGKELSAHAAFKVDTRTPVYFADELEG